MFVRSPTLPVAFLPQSDRKVAIWHKWQSFGREECAEESLEMGLRRQKKRFSTERSRESSRWMRDWAIFLGFCVQKVGQSCRCGGERGRRRAGGVRSGRGVAKSPQVFPERRGVFAKSGGFSSRTCAVFLRPCCRLGQSGRRYKKKLPAFRRMGECAQVVALRFLSGVTR